MAESSQNIAKRILADLETLAGQGKLQAHQIDPLRSDLGAIANPPAPPVVARRPVTAQQPRKQFKAIWSYDGAQLDELSFVEGDHIELVQDVSEGWSRGCVIRSDGSKSDEGMFPSNYVEPIPDNAAAESAAFSPPLPPRITASSAASINSMDTGDEKRAGGVHDNRYQAMTPWQPGVPRWSSGGAPLPPPSPNHTIPSAHAPHQSPSNAGYYSQPPMPYGPNTPDAYGHGHGHSNPANSINALQPVPVTEEDKKKHDKLKKMGGRLGNTMLGGFAGGVGFGVGSHLF